VSSSEDESWEESCSDESRDEPVGSLLVVGSASEVRVGVADPVPSLSDVSSSSDDADSSSEPVVGALVPVAGAVVEDGDDGSSSCCTLEDDDALVIAPIVVSCDVCVPPTSADTGFCPISSMPVMTPMAMAKTAAA
jgi:hypothetical protein